MTLSRYGLREWLAITLIALVFAAGLAWLHFWWGLIPVAIIWLALIAFFRDPWRPAPQGLAPGVMLSPADGTVSAVLRVDQHDSTGGAPAVVVRIFLSVLDVHINRWPCDGTVVSIVHKPGTYFDARTEESAATNESNLITLRRERGETVGVRQVAGKIARRIVCPVAIGEHARRGRRFGMIKFGSTTELILPRPDDVRVHVQVGEKVKGGLTMLATLGDAR